MSKLRLTPEEIEQFRLDGRISLAVAEEAMVRSGFRFDDIERITGVYEHHKWGSDADRKYRDRLTKKAIRMVAKNPIKYTE